MTVRLNLCPTQKRCFFNAREAWARLCEIRAEARHGSSQRAIPKRIYQCPECGWWHLTSKRRLD